MKRLIGPQSALRLPSARIAIVVSGGNTSAVSFA